MKSMMLILLCLIIIAGRAFAQGTPEERAACTPDVFKLCSSDIPNISAIISCLQHKKPQLSQACRVVMTKSAANTRSLSGKTPWCNVSRELASDEPWRQWCGDKAW